MAVNDQICLYEEPYVTVNGEGHFIGTPAVFVRTMGCHVGCRWCDAMPTWPSPKSGIGIWYTNGQLTKILDTNCPRTPRIWLTGGEPTEHSEELLSFIQYYKKHGKVKRIWHMITAGAKFHIGLLQELDKITIDIKPPSSGTTTPEEFISWCFEDEQLLRKLDFKMVVDRDVKDINFALQQIKLLRQFNRDITIQPMYWSDPTAKQKLKAANEKGKVEMFKEQFAQPQNWESLGEFAEHFMEIVDYPNLRILTQLHKVYWPGQFDHI